VPRFLWPMVYGVVTAHASLTQVRLSAIVLITFLFLSGSLQCLINSWTCKWYDIDGATLFSKVD